MGFFQDNLKPFFKKRELAFVESRQETDGIYSFVFEQEKGLTWKAGQYGLFTITHKKIANATRPFSVSSAPAENRVQFTTVIGDNPSDFKQALLELKPGMKVSMRGPVGPFYLKEERPTLLIAGGIGITPMRSILKQMAAEGRGGRKPTTLLCMDSSKSGLFQDELDQMADSASLQVAYLALRNELHQEIDAFVSLHQNEGKYYIAGPKEMVDSIAAYLAKNHISKQNIQKDVFMGYN